MAHAAYSERNAALSRMAHELTSAAAESHQHGTGQYIKAAVFGGLDGIITTFAVVASVTGANLAPGIVIVMVWHWARRLLRVGCARLFDREMNFRSKSFNRALPTCWATACPWA